MASVWFRRASIRLLKFLQIKERGPNFWEEPICETKMDKVKCNDKENEILKEKSQESCGLTFPLQDSGELSIPFLSCFKSFDTNYRSRHQDLFNI